MNWIRLFSYREGNRKFTAFKLDGYEHYYIGQKPPRHLSTQRIMPTLYLAIVNHLHR